MANLKNRRKIYDVLGFTLTPVLVLEDEVVMEKAKGYLPKGRSIV